MMRKFMKVSYAPEDVKLPTRKTKCSAGYDFYLPEDVTVPAHGYSKMVPTYIKAAMENDDVLLLFVRSSIGIKKHCGLANHVAVIDADFCDNPDNEGNISLVLYNYGDTDLHLEKGERIMQGMFVKYGIVDNDNATEERTGGIGSTNK